MLARSVPRVVVPLTRTVCQPLRPPIVTGIATETMPFTPVPNSGSSKPVWFSMDLGSHAPTVTEVPATGIVSSAPRIFGGVNRVMGAANCRNWKPSSPPPHSSGVRVFRSTVLILPIVSCELPIRCPMVNARSKSSAFALGKFNAVLIGSVSSPPWPFTLFP